MYGLLWRALPGPFWFRALVMIALAVGVVVLCFEIVFPAIADYMPFNEQTVGE